MASRVKHKTALLDLVDECLAYSVLLVEAQTTNTSSSRSFVAVLPEIKSHSAERVSQIVQGQATDKFVVSLYEKWLVECLLDIQKQLTSINVPRIRQFQAAKQPTSKIFEDFIDAATKAITSKPKGVDDCLGQIFKNHATYKDEGIGYARHIAKLSRQIASRLRIFRSAKLRLLFSGWLWLGLLALALLSIPVFYAFGAIGSSGASVADAGPVIQEKLRADQTALATIAQNSREPLLDRTVKIVKHVWELVDTIPKILNGLVVGLGALLALFRRK